MFYFSNSTKRIKYFIRTTLERKLDESVSRELGEDYTLLVDYEHKPVESFIKQLQTISNHNSVLLEDDLILCKDFKTKIEKVINQYPNKIINFFTFPNAYFKTKVCDKLVYNQCTYYPKGIGNIIAKEMKNFKKGNEKYGYDYIEDLALKKLHINIVIYRPCLVQHIDYKSLITPDIYSRRSPYFIDYLDELGISYEDASKIDNQIKLRNLMIEKFTEV